MYLIPLEIIGIAAAYAIFALLLQRKLSNVDKNYEIRAKLNTLTKELMDMAKKNGDQAAMQEKQKELSVLSMESMKSQMKPMLVVLPSFIILYYLILPMVFPSTLTLKLINYNLSYKTYFFVIAFILGIVLSIAVSMYDRVRLKHKYKFGIMGPSLKPNEEPPKALS